jgi:ankyrin repeat protein
MRSALHWAAMHGLHEATIALLQNGHQVNQTDLSGRAALHEAAARGDIKQAEILLAHGANPSLASLSCRNSLHVLAAEFDPQEYKQHRKVAAELICHGVDVNARDAKGTHTYLRAERCELIDRRLHSPAHCSTERSSRMSERVAPE